MTTITETGHNLAGIQQALLDERSLMEDAIRYENAQFTLSTKAHESRIEFFRNRIAAIDAIIGSDEAEERKAA